MNRVRDLIDPMTEEVWSEAKKRRFIRDSLKVEGEFVIGHSRPDIMGFRQRTLQLFSGINPLPTLILERVLGFPRPSRRPLGAPVTAHGPVYPWYG